MRVAEFIFSVIIAAAVVFLVFQNNEKEPQLLSAGSNGFTIEFKTVPQALHDSLVTIPLKITGPKTEKIKYLVRYARPELRDAQQLHRYGATPLTAIDSANGEYQTSIRTSAKGSISYFYFEVRDPVGRPLCELKNSDGQALKTLAIGKLDSWVYYGHYLVMLVAVMSITFGAISSLKLFTEKNQSDSPLTPFLIGAILAIVSGLLLNTLMRMQLTGITWLGAPFGTSLADNLVQILIVYLLFTYLVSRTARTKSGHSKRIGSATLPGSLGIGAFFLMILAYLLPILITSPIEFIGIMFYAVLALLALAYLLMFRSAQNA